MNKPFSPMPKGSAESRDQPQVDLELTETATSAPPVIDATPERTGDHLGEIIEVTGAGAVALLKLPARQESKALVAGQNGLAGGVGSFVRIPVDNAYVYGVIRSVFRDRGDTASDRCYANIEFVGQTTLAPDAPDQQVYSPGVHTFPTLGSDFFEAVREDIDEIFSPRDQAHISVGTIYPNHDLPASLLTQNLLNGHFAILGSTGTGKSCMFALIVHRLIEQMPFAHILLLDPHNEYARAFGDSAACFDTGNLKLPYWLMNFVEHIEVFIGERTPDREGEIEILRRAILSAREKSRAGRELGRVTVDMPLPYAISDMMFHIESEIGRTEKVDQLVPLRKLKAKIESLMTDQRYGFMFSGLLLNDSLADIISQLFRMPVNGKPIAVIDLSSVPSDIANVVVSVLGRLVLDFAVWSRQDTSLPILMVLEEAHRFIPNKDVGNFGSPMRTIKQIAREGRKYGVTLGFISQRPADLSETVLSQCSTVFAMRMNNERDQNFVANILPEGSHGILDGLASLQNREVIAVGAGVGTPIRIMTDELKDHEMPHSNHPTFPDIWQSDHMDQGQVRAVIQRWRTQSR